MEVLLIFFALIGIFLIKHLFFWSPLDVSHLYQNGPLKIGHRGSPKEAPENTLPSYKNAVSSGLSAIEIDVVGTKDSKLVCSHNIDLERETDSFGYIDEKTYAELVNVNAGVKFDDYSPTRMPLLEEVLEELPDDLIINIEIKTRKVFDKSIVDAVVETIQRKKIHHRTIISCFNPLVICLVKWRDSNIITAYIWDVESVPPLLKKPLFVNLVHPDLFHPCVDLVNEGSMRFARRKGLKINVWTVNNQPTINWLLKMGIDGIFGDFPHLLLNKLKT
ncbi:MAG: hypothetical protein ISR95_09060 [Candidatus Marinimicrobia bacterium]|nr:hypothetical protein [Candidatus Neomarinimicrobiota bacterium]